MVENTEVIFSLDIRMSNAPPQRVRITKRTVLGSSEDADISIQGRGLNSKHLIFKQSHSALQVTCLGPDVKIGKSQVEKGNARLLDKGDKVSVGELEIIIRHEELTEKSTGNAPTSITNIQAYKEKLDEIKEDAHISKLSFFQKLKHRFERKKKVVKKDKKKFEPKAAKGKLQFSQPVANKPPPVIARMTGMLAELTWCFIAYQYFLFSFFEENLKPHWQQYAKPIIDSIGEKNYLQHDLVQEFIKIQDDSLFLNKVLYFGVVFMLLQLPIIMLLGSSLTMTLIGATYKGNAIVKRLRAMLVWLGTPLDFMLFPINLLTIGGLPTIREMVFLSPLKVSNASKALLYSFFVHPTLLIAALLGPFVLDESFIDRKLIITQSPLTSKLDKNLLTHWYDFDQQYFLPVVQSDRILTFPKLNKKNERQFISLSPDANSTNIIATTEKFSLDESYQQNLLSQARDFNPLLDIFVEEIKFSDLMIDSFNLSTDTFIDQMVKYGPFLAFLLPIRKSLFEALGYAVFPDIKQMMTPAGEAYFTMPNSLTENNLSLLILANEQSLFILKATYPNAATGLITQLEKNSFNNISKKKAENESPYLALEKKNATLPQLSSALKDWKIMADFMKNIPLGDQRLLAFKDFTQTLAPEIKRFKAQNKKVTKEEKEIINQFEKYLK